MRVLNQMAQLILEDPFITAKQIARHLGYAEEKSVYYWVEKTMYHGLNGFKRAVLSGQYRVSSSVAREPGSRYGRVPVVAGFHGDCDPILSGDTIPIIGVTGAQWLWRYPGPVTGPFSSLDSLVLAKWADDISTAHWCLAHRPVFERPVIRLVCRQGESSWLLDPTSMQVDNDSEPRYAILQLIRAL